MSAQTTPEGYVNKFWAKSKTVWFALCTTLAGFWDQVKPYTDDLRNALGPHWFAGLMVGIGLITLTLRSLSSTNITMTKPTDKGP